MITILHRGGPPKWLQYYIGVVWQMITVYPESWVVTLGILFPKTWQKNIFFSCQKVISGRYVKTITTLHRGGTAKWLQHYIGGVCPNNYNITWGGGGLGTPKRDYVICARPLSLVLYWLHIMFSASCCLDQFQTELNPQGHGTLHKQIQSQKGNWAYWYKLLQRYKYRAIRAIFSIIDFLLFSIVSVPFNFHYIWWG